MFPYFYVIMLLCFYVLCYYYYFPYYYVIPRSGNISGNNDESLYASGRKFTLDDLSIKTYSKHFPHSKLFSRLIRGAFSKSKLWSVSLWLATNAFNVLFWKLPF